MSHPGGDLGGGDLGGWQAGQTGCLFRQGGERSGPASQSGGPSGPGVCGWNRQAGVSTEGPAVALSRAPGRCLGNHGDTGQEGSAGWLAGALGPTP